MNELINSCKFIGRLGKDPEATYLPSGTMRLTFGLAVNMAKRKDGETTYEATWVDVTAFGQRAEALLKLTKKGTLVAVEAEYGKNHWENQEGEKRVSHNFVVRSFQILADRRKAEEAEEDSGADDTFSDENLPF